MTLSWKLCHYMHGLNSPNYMQLYGYSCYSNYLLSLMWLCSNILLLQFFAFLTLKPLFQWIEEPTLLVTRFEYANLFHTVSDWYSAYVASRVTGLPSRPHLVFVDGHCKVFIPNFPLFISFVSFCYYVHQLSYKDVLIGFWYHE